MLFMKVENYLEMLLEVDYFQIKATQGKGLKILTPASKQMLQRLQITLAQVKVGNTSENILNEIRKIIYSFYRAKKVTKKVYMNLII